MNPLRAIVSDRVRLYEDSKGFKASYYDLAGSRRWVRIPAASEAEAKTKLHALQREITKRPELRGEYKPSIAISTWLADFQRLYPRLAPRTHASIATSARKLIAHTEDAALSALTPLLIREWVASLKGSPFTVARDIRQVKWLLRAAVDAEHIAANPARNESGSPPAVDRVNAFIDDRTTAKILKACQTDGERALIGLARWAGLRRGEALRLRWRDVNLKARRLTVTNESGVRTTKQRVRVVPIDPRLAQLLAPMATKPEAQVVPGISRSRSGQITTRAIFDRAGVTGANPLHDLRRSRVTEWVESGHDVYAVAKWTGHSPQVAMQYYHRVTDAAMDRAAGLSDPRVTPKPSRVGGKRRKLVKNR